MDLCNKSSCIKQVFSGHLNSRSVVEDGFGLVFQMQVSNIVTNKDLSWLLWKYLTLRRDLVGEGERCAM